MKRTLVLLVAVLLLLTSCAAPKQELSSYSSGELRKLIDDAREEANVRFAELGPAIAKKFVAIMNENGYRIEIEVEKSNYFKFCNLDNPSFYMTLMHHAACCGSINGDIAEEDLRACFSAMLAAIAHTEKNSRIRSVESYADLLERDIPFGAIPADVSCTHFLDGYLCSLSFSSKTMDYGYCID